MNDIVSCLFLDDDRTRQAKAEIPTKVCSWVVTTSIVSCALEQSLLSTIALLKFSVDYNVGRLVLHVAATANGVASQSI